MEIYNDNDILKTIQGLDESKKIDNSNKLPEFTSDNIINWALPQNSKSSIKKIASTFNNFVKEGFTKEQSLEMIYAENKFKEEEIDNFKELLNKNAQKINKVERRASRKELIMKNIEELATNLSEDKFIDLVTGSGKTQNGLVIFAQVNEEKSLRSSLRNFKKYNHNQNFLNEIYAYIQPFINDELKKSTLTAAKMNKSKTAYATKNRNNNIIISSDDEIFIVDLNKFACTCDRFKNSNFSKLGIPCEHIILAQMEEKVEGGLEKELDELDYRIKKLDYCVARGECSREEEAVFADVYDRAEEARMAYEEDDLKYCRKQLEICNDKLESVGY